jgi:X-Pro dipeptidyl-peptidase
MVGKSYDGGTQWEAAASGNPHLKTIVPVEGVPDVFELLFGNGTPDWRGPLVLNDVYYAQSVAFYLNGRAPEHTAQVAACPDYATGTAASAISAETGQVDPFGYWAARRYRGAIERRYRGSVLLVQGLADWNVNPGQQFPWISRLERRGVPVKKLIGQWGHSFPDQEDPPVMRPDWPDILLAWFDRWLRGRSGADLGPAVQVEDSQGRWRNAAAWPPPGTARTLWATAGGRLAAAPGEGVASATLAPDPVHSQGGGLGINPPDPIAGQCAPPNCASFAGAPYPAGQRFAGLPSLRLTVTPSAPSGQVSAYLYAVGADGAEERLGWGQADVRFPHGGDDPQPVEPGQPMALDVPLQPLDAVVAPGAHLVLVLSQGHAYNRLSYAPSAPMQLATGGRASSLTFTEIHPPAGDFFDPNAAR